MRAVALAYALALAAIALAAGQAGTADATLDDLLQRAGAYVTRFEWRFSNVVAEERYTQRAHDLRPGAMTAGRSTIRELVSDFLLVKVPSEETWLPFRDVFEVDGKPVRDRQDRLTKLFLQPAATAFEQAAQIIAESARYNIGVQRNINLPVLALLVLRPTNQRRFRFSNVKADSKAGPDVWSIEFREQSRPTLIHGTGETDLFSRGLLWIEASSGRVVKTQLIVEDLTIRADITTEYRFDPAFNLDVPARMEEFYVVSRSATRFSGTATYSKFRRFSVEVDEQIATDRPELVEIQAGRFTMGSGRSEHGRNADETPHEVTIGRPFLIGRFEVTEQQWQVVMGANPSHFADCGPTCPVENVSFDDVQRFLERLNGQPAIEFVYRLPTEAEWEYACRAGTTTPFATGANVTTDQANYNGRYPYASFAPGVFRERPTPVGSFPKNTWGLADMHGNVWEWTADWYGPYDARPSRDPGGPSTGEKRVIRGGSWQFDANSARCALRYTHAPADRGFSLGFRVAADRRPR